ncbi:MAG: hypothetical protein WCT31_00715 [Candidatus Micrarchaeia archaeon]|jgi:hypothetical protein
MIKQIGLTLSIIFLIFTLGCIQLPNPGNSFELNKNFNISQGETLINQEANLTVKAISFANSLCPSGVTCIWAGELGVNLQVNNETIYLGTQTRKNTIYLSRSIELISINYDTKQATLKIS